MSRKKIKNVLISVYHKDNLMEILRTLKEYQAHIYSTGGTYDFIKENGYEATAVEEITGYPSILGGRVKTLHPKIFGGLLARTHMESDREDLARFEIPVFDLVVVDLYPFEATLASGADEKEIIEKIDIGGVSLIRAAAKNYPEVLIISSREQYIRLLELLHEKNGYSDLEDRKYFAALAFHVSSHYDTAIFNYFNKEYDLPYLKISDHRVNELRYGENPHQKGVFYGDLGQVLEQYHGKELSYNNLVDVEAAVNLVREFRESPAFVIIKHTNACGVATGADVREAYLKALAADTVSAFGGVLASNRSIDLQAAEEINKLFFEVLIAPGFDEKALEILRARKNRILLLLKQEVKERYQVKSLLQGFLVQEKDWKTDEVSDLKTMTKRQVTAGEVESLLFASKVCKHTKSNTIVLARNGQLLSSGVGQTSRVDALKQAIEKARSFNMDLKGAVMASDAFFPFPDCVEIAGQAGITVVIQPGGSIKDQDSINYCDQHNMAMVFTGFRHFKH